MHFDLTQWWHEIPHTHFPRILQNIKWNLLTKPIKPVVSYSPNKRCRCLKYEQEETSTERLSLATMWLKHYVMWRTYAATIKLPQLEEEKRAHVWSFSVAIRPFILTEREDICDKVLIRLLLVSFPATTGPILCSPFGKITFKLMATVRTAAAKEQLTRVCTAHVAPVSQSI